MLVVFVWIVFIATGLAGGNVIVRGLFADPSTGTAPAASLRERILAVDAGRRVAVLGTAGATITVVGLVVALVPEVPTQAAPLVLGVGYLALAVYGTWWGVAASRASREAEELRRRFEDIVAPLRRELRS